MWDYMEIKLTEKTLSPVCALTLKLIIFHEKERPDIRYILKGDRSSLLPSPPKLFNLSSLNIQEGITKAS